MFKRRIPRPKQDVKRRLERGILMMNKYYTLEAIVEGKLIKFPRHFKTRNEAMNYIFQYYDRHHLVELRVNEEYFIDENKHDIAYVYDYENRFRIARA